MKKYGEVMTLKNLEEMYQKEILGKTEIWYVVEAEEESFIILGTNRCTKDEFKKAIKGGDPEKHSVEKVESEILEQIK